MRRGIKPIRASIPGQICISLNHLNLAPTDGIRGGVRVVRYPVLRRDVREPLGQQAVARDRVVGVRYAVVLVLWRGGLGGNVGRECQVSEARLAVVILQMGSVNKPNEGLLDQARYARMSLPSRYSESQQRHMQPVQLPGYDQ